MDEPVLLLLKWINLYGKSRTKVLGRLAGRLAKSTKFSKFKYVGRLLKFCQNLDFETGCLQYRFEHTQFWCKTGSVLYVPKRRVWTLIEGCLIFHEEFMEGYYPDEKNRSRRDNILIYIPVTISFAFIKFLANRAPHNRIQEG